MSTLIQTKYGKANINNKGYYDIVSEHEGNFRKKLHRLIYEDYHKVTLLPTTDIHHIDGDKLNNDIENLEAISHAEHSRRHMIGENNPMLNKNHTEENMLKMSSMKSTSGYYRVYKQKNKKYTQGFFYKYQYYDEDKKRRNISRKSIPELKEAVLEKGLPWKKFDEVEVDDEY